MVNKELIQTECSKYETYKGKAEDMISAMNTEIKNERQYTGTLSDSLINQGNSIISELKSSINKANTIKVNLNKLIGKVEESEKAKKST